MNESGLVNQRIKKYRVLAGYTQEKAAAELGMKKSSYARMERYGNPNVNALVKLATLFHVPLETLVYGLDPQRFNTTVDNGAPSFFEQPNSANFKSEPPFILTTNEKNCIKLFRNLSNEKRDELMKYINDFCKKNTEIPNKKGLLIDEDIDEEL